MPQSVITVGDRVFGEFSERAADDDGRVTIPCEIREGLRLDVGAGCIVARERDGCLSVWSESTWKDQVSDVLDAVDARRLPAMMDIRQALGRLVSTRQAMRVDGKGRIKLPVPWQEEIIYTDRKKEPPTSYVTIVACGSHAEVWNPKLWEQYLSEAQPAFWRLFDDLSRERIAAP